jgi:hypothetical protein
MLKLGASVRRLELQASWEGLAEAASPCRVTIDGKLALMWTGFWNAACWRWD